MAGDDVVCHLLVVAGAVEPMDGATVIDGDNAKTNALARGDALGHPLVAAGVVEQMNVAIVIAKDIDAGKSLHGRLEEDRALADLRKDKRGSTCRMSRNSWRESNDACERSYWKIAGEACV